MYQDVLNLNKSTKSILKNPDPKTSLAYSNSILRKDPTKITQEGIGLNPNVPLEDEYIQNLQKQIHFMDLEIKLMKEKGAQEEALGGNYQFSKIGLADGKVPSDHIMTTTSKVKQMKNDLTKQINLLDQDLLKQREENTIDQAKVANVVRHVHDYDEKLGKILQENTESLTQMRTKFMVERKQREEVEMDINKIKQQLDKILEENERLKKETQTRVILENLEQKQFDQEEAMHKENIEVKVRLIDNLQTEKTQLYLVTEKNPRLQSLRDENEKLINSVHDAEKKLDNYNYKVLETEALQLLSLKKKEEDQEIRKKLQTELEKWREQLDDTIRQNELKVERKLREAESPVIKELQAVLLKERHELNELKAKLDAIYAKEKEYIIDQNNRIRYLDTLTKKKEANIEANKIFTDEIKELDPRVNDAETNVEALRLAIADAREERQKLQAKLKIVEEENIVLLSKYQFMQHHIKLEDDMKKFNVEDLRNVVQTNITVNDTIKDFMEKWDNLKRFSKVP